MTEQLDELDKLEMWDLTKVLRPDMTFEEFEADWREFQEFKAERAKN